MVERRVARAGGLDEDLQVLAGLALANEIAELLRPQVAFEIVALGRGPRDQPAGIDRSVLCRLRRHWASSFRPARISACTLASLPSVRAAAVTAPERSEEHTSELQSLMRISYAGFCLK